MYKIDRRGGGSKNRFLGNNHACYYKILKNRQIQINFNLTLFKTFPIQTQKNTITITNHNIFFRLNDNSLAVFVLVLLLTTSTLKAILNCAEF